ncbi:MAG: hypothetical protein ACRD8O_08500, partial [Bryobacteraceae bacterium]
VGAATNVVAPGVGTVIGSAIGGGGYMAEMQQFLELQRAVNMEQRQYEAQSNVMKAKHDAAMSAIRNIK